jgi:hypothetical protein
MSALRSKFLESAAPAARTSEKRVFLRDLFF